MKRLQTLLIFAILTLLFACSENKLEQKGFAIVHEEETETSSGISDYSGKNNQMKTQPSNVILTGLAEHRLATIYKVNLNKETGKTFIGSNNYHYSYSNNESESDNNWNYHYMPGFEALYGYNLVNISHFDTNNTHHYFFKSPVLIKTFYFPAFEHDTLNGKPVNRNYYMMSVYDEDTNNDSLINVSDLRRFYLFDIHGKNKTPLIPLNYSVIKSEYDSANDFMYVFAKIDENSNGKKEENEATHIFLVDLKNPTNRGKQY